MRGKLYIRIEYLAACAFSVLLLTLLVLKPQFSMKGVQNGLYICAGQIIPALFPFCVISSFLVNSGIISVLGKVLSPISKRVFKLPEICAGAILMSFTGGFPVGAITANELFERGEITQNEYKKMMLFCVNAGPAFVIGTVGNAILGNVKIGILIFLSLTLSGIILGILSNFCIMSECERRENIKDNEICTLSDALIKSVSTATYTMLNVCAWIMLFSCLLEFINSLNVSQFFKDFVISMSEVTRGCAVSKNYKNIPLTTFIIGWSGISVHLQIFKFIRASGLKTIHFLCARLINASVACLISFIILKFFPDAQNVFGSIASPCVKAFSVSVPSAVCMLIMGVSFILELDRNKRKC